MLAIRPVAGAIMVARDDVSPSAITIVKNCSSEWPS
jgi:hypothetical protein